MNKVFILLSIVICTAACGGASKAGEAVPAPVEITHAYYIAEVGGVKGSGTNLSYFVHLNEIPEGIRFDSAWVDGERVGVMQMPGRPLLRTARGSDGSTAQLTAVKIRGYENDRPFYLRSDSVYLKEKIFLPAAQPGR